MTALADPGVNDVLPMVFNALGGISNPNLRLLAQEGEAAVGRSGTRLDARALADLRSSGTTAVNITLGYVFGDEDPFEYSVAEIARWNRNIQAHPDQLLKVRSASDIRTAKESGRTGVIYGFQNTEMLGTDAGRVATFAGLGTRVVQLTYNGANAVGAGSMVPENTGLTPFGHDVVAELNANRVLVDLGHSGEATCLDAIAASTAPICISHTGCRALADLPRNKTDQELRGVAQGGGVVGIYFMPFLAEDSFPGAVDVVRHIVHAINVCGEDHVGIGTDGGTTQIDDMPAYHKLIDDEIARRKAAGIGARGEKPGVVPFIPDLQGPDQFRKLATLMADAGLSSRVIEKVLGLNFLRLVEDVWGQ
ncbi:peptidase M19 [Marinihelvus fidelis]|uniref:Peptidase M19 n=2 Tax=Marinihelvus fidelis TaxID=2613842 RepID=A0A5N0T8Q6_9GAMM|nr:peptidase M19 [Marinihelvus fidelis]